MNITEIRELIQLVIESGVAEIEVQRGEDRVWIRRATTSNNVHEIVVPNAAAPAAPPAPPAAHYAAAAAAPSSTIVPPPMEPPAAQAEDKLITVRAPIVGTFYESPSPGSAPFVKPGDTVRPGQILCIIEAMKLMNEIEAEVPGVIVAKLVENGSPIEYGQVLFTIRPV